jgi:adenosylmethionine-8-amino-7-oxononanoate aminotransferase
VWLRPFRDLVYAMPPYVMSDAELGMVGKAVAAAVAAAAASGRS